jgi:hypothetical protein
MTEHKKPACWGVRFTTPPQHEQRWWGNHDVSVFAMTAERAIEVIKEQYPGAEIHQVNRKSSGEVIFDKELHDLEC